MIEMSVSHQDRVHLRRARRLEFRVYAVRPRCARPPEGGTRNVLRCEMTHSISDARNVRLNARTKRNAQKIHAGEIRIDKQCVTFEFELIAVRAEISCAHSVVPRCGRITDNQVSRGAESCTEGLRREHQPKKETHSTTDNADAAERKEGRCPRNTHQSELNKTVAVVAAALRAVFLGVKSKRRGQPATGPHTGRIRPAANRWLQHLRNRS